MPRGEETDGEGPLLVLNLPDRLFGTGAGAWPKKQKEASPNRFLHRP